MPRIMTVGTDARQALADNPDRRAWNIVMPATTVESGNTGRVHVGLGFQPSGNISDPAQGHILLAGDQLRDEMLFQTDYSVFRGSIWVRASIAGQRIWVDEALRSDPVGTAPPVEGQPTPG